ncbi:hypothetical protein [Desulfotalea psychrophila]|nr:hypothetical protein [Desulfotalea psychrophila]
MSVYEFYCKGCNTILKFSGETEGAGQPSCPLCGAAGLVAEKSRFFLGENSADTGREALLAGLTEEKIGLAFEQLGKGAEVDGSQSMVDLLQSFSCDAGLAPTELLKKVLSEGVDSERVGQLEEDIAFRHLVVGGEDLPRRNERVYPLAQYLWAC